MIYVDNRTGSKELLPLFPPGTAALRRLQFADFSFSGNGPDNIPWQIGIERKTLSDLINCMKSGRFTGHQLPGLINGYNEVYLLVEGLFKADPSTGILLEHTAGRWKPVSFGFTQYMLRDIWLFLTTIEVVTGVRWHTASCPRETARFVSTLHRWWTFKEFADHRSHLQPNTGNIAGIGSFSLVRRVATQLSGIGWEKSKLIDCAFDSVEQMVAASASDWQQLDGIGKKLSKSIMNELRGCG